MECKDRINVTARAGRRVLIETLWNVKQIKTIAEELDLSRINRNIVECKVSCNSGKWRAENRINRNIVECKVVFVLSFLDVIFCINRNIVECKELMFLLSFSLSNCINRNIVECKVIIGSSRFSLILVLIETLWNVKGGLCPGFGRR